MNYLSQRLWSAIPVPVRHNFKINIYYMIATGIFGGCYASFYGIIARDEFKAGPFWISLVVAAQYLSGLVSCITTSFVPKGKEGVYSRAIHIFSSLFLIGSAFARSAETFCFMLFLFHMTACYGPLEDSVYAYLYPLNIRSKMMGYTKIFSVGTSSVAVLLAGLVINMTLYGISVWKGIFIVAGIAHAMRGVIRCFYKTDIEPDTNRPNPFAFIKKSFKLLVENKFNIIIIISGVLLTSSFTLFCTLIPMYQVDVLHLTGREVSILTVVSYISLLFAYPMLGTFFTKTGPIKAWLYAFPFVIIMPLFYIFLGNSWYPLILGTILYSGFGVVNDICWINLLIYLGGEDRLMEYQAFYAFIGGLRAIIGLLASTYIINTCDKMQFSHTMNLKIAFLVGVGITFVGFLICLGLLKYKKK